VGQDAREPYFERPCLAVLRDVREHLDKCVLHRLVRFSGIAEVLIRDARRAMLVRRHERAEPLARLVHFAAFDEAADLGGEPRIVRYRQYWRAPVSVWDRRFSRRVRRWCPGVESGPLNTHKALRFGAKAVYSLPHSFDAPCVDEVS